MYEYEGWRLIYALKWQTNSYDDSYNEPLKIALKSAFEKLGYEDPAAEVEVMTMYMDGIVTAMILHEPEDKKAILKSIQRLSIPIPIILSISDLLVRLSKRLLLFF